MKLFRCGFTAACLLLALVGCGERPAGELISVAATAPRFFAEGRPATLAQWGQLTRGNGRLQLGEGVVPYALNTALFSDYALKLRTVWIPPDAGGASYAANASFAFPVGTVITKTFYYPREGANPQRVLAAGTATAHFDGRALKLAGVRLMETRVLVHRAAGWEALPYVWDEAQQEAVLKRTGDFIDLTLVHDHGEAQPFTYTVPDANQCGGCHITDAASKALWPIGPKARHLNRSYAYAEGAMNQLDYWAARGLLKGSPNAQARPRAAAWNGLDAVPAGARAAVARSYLDINCAHCHSRTGPARNSGLYLHADEAPGPALGICKPPIAAGRGTGGRRFGIVPGDADASIFTYRMRSVRPDSMMPELGRATVHAEGVRLVSDWIDASGAIGSHGCSA